MKREKLILEKIDIYGGTQTRIATNDEAIVAYAESMSEGVQFPPITVFFDGAAYWLADGFHRYLAAKQNKYDSIEAEVHEGGRTDALVHALGANSTNGLFRSNADKRNAVEIALEEWWEHSNSYISDVCKVSNDLVTKVRRASGRKQPEKVTGRDGKQYPAQVEREPRGKTEKSSSDSSGGGGGGGAVSKKNANLIDIPGGSQREIEAEARKMIRNGELDPRELENIPSAEPTDFAYAAINLLERADLEDPKFAKALTVLEKWLNKQMAVSS